LDGLPAAEAGGDYRAPRFAVLTGEHRCYKCEQLARVSAIALAGFEERDCEDGDFAPGEDTVLLITITALNPQAAHAISELSPWMRMGHSQTAGMTYLANHCEHCQALIGAWFIKKPGEAFFPETDEQARQLSITWIEQWIEVEDEGGVMASWLDHLLNMGHS
jgi:hypothetical protein